MDPRESMLQPSGAGRSMNMPMPIGGGAGGGTQSVLAMLLRTLASGARSGTPGGAGGAVSVGNPSGGVAAAQQQRLRDPNAVHDPERDRLIARALGLLSLLLLLAPAPAPAGDGGRGYGAGGSNGAAESGAPGSATGNASGRGLGGMSYEEALSAARMDALRHRAIERARMQREFMDAWRAGVQTYESLRGGNDGHVAGSGAPSNGGYGRDGTNFGH